MGFLLLIKIYIFYLLRAQNIIKKNLIFKRSCFLKKYPKSVFKIEINGVLLSLKCLSRVLSYSIHLSNRNVSQ